MNTRERAAPPTLVKLPTATRCVPLGSTEKRSTSVAPAPVPTVPVIGRLM